jgi:polar amino acid transport system substrate-binding protein
MLLTWLLLALPAAALAGPLQVVLFEVAPYAQVQQGRASGLYVDLVQGLLDSAGFSAEFRVLPFARLPIALAQGDADLTIAFTTEALDRVATPLLPVALVDSIVVARKADPLGDLNALKGKTVGRARGGCRDLAAQEQLGLRWVDVSGFDSALRMLVLGRLDAVCLTREVLRHQLQATGLDPGALGSPLVVAHRKVWMYIRPGLDAATVERLRAALGRRTPARLD